MDIFRFQAVATTTLTIRLFAAPGSRLDPLLIAFSDSQTPILEDDDSDVTLNPAGTLNLRHRPQ